MTKMRLVISGALLMLTIDSACADDTTFKPLSDAELSEVQGQALMNLTYTDPSKANSSMASQNIGFYKLGMEAELELNANIKKLQLGCGGINGAGGCDIDIDNLSLSGIAETREGRVSSSAKMTNPFVEFAIKNPNSASTREIMGFRLSAEKVLGMLTLGEENSDKPNGINSLSGYMKIQDTTGVGYTQPRTMSYTDTGMKINGNVRACVLILCPTLGFDSDNYSLNLDSASADIFINGTTINGRRLNSVQLSGYANINQLNFSGDLRASITILLGLLKLQKKVDGNITGLKADITVNENLGYIHKLKLNNPFSLSMQKQDIFWNGAAAAAQRGWWLAIEDPIDIGNVNPSKKIDITNDVLKQVVNPISNYIKANPPTCGVIDCLFGDSLTVGNVNLPNTRVDFPLKDLQLQNQTFAPNCYGSLKFC